MFVEFELRFGKKTELKTEKKKMTQNEKLAKLIFYPSWILFSIKKEF